MSDRPTPETDAAYKYWPSENAELVDADFARNLERKRDEAREALENHTASTIHSCHVNCKRPMCVLRRERDEAREALRTLAEHGEKEMQKLQNALMEIEDRCVDCEDACDDIKKIRDIAAKALEGIPERHELYIWKNGKYELDP